MDDFCFQIMSYPCQFGNKAGMCHSVDMIALFVYFFIFIYLLYNYFYNLNRKNISCHWNTNLLLSLHLKILIVALIAAFGFLVYQILLLFYDIPSFYTFFLEGNFIFIDYLVLGILYQSNPSNRSFKNALYCGIIALLSYYILHHNIGKKYDNFKLTSMEVYCFKQHGEVTFLNYLLSIELVIYSYCLYISYSRSKQNMFLKNEALHLWSRFFFMIIFSCIIGTNLIYFKMDIGYCIYTIAMCIYYFFYPYLIFSVLLIDSLYWKSIVGCSIDQANLLFMSSITNLDNKTTTTTTNDDFQVYNMLTQDEDINEIYNASKDIRNFAIKHRSSCLPYKNFQKIKFLGSGTFANIDLCTYLNTEELVAIKKYKLEFLELEGQNQYIQRISRETAIQNMLNSKYIVKSKGFYFNLPILGNVLEYCYYGSLTNYLKVIKPNISKKIQIAIEIAYGLQYIHQKKIIHLDIKAENILITKHHQAKISDFGSAKYIDQQHKNTNSFFNTIEGTIPWLAPEIIDCNNNQKINTKVDIYSYGILLWEIFSEELPYLLPDSYEIKQQQQQQDKKEVLNIDIINNNNNNLNRPLLTRTKSAEITTHKQKFHTRGYTNTLNDDDDNELPQSFTFSESIFDNDNISKSIIVPKVQFPIWISDVKEKICNQNKRPPLIILNDIPQELKDLISICWDKDPNKRPNASEIIIKLKDLL